MTQTLRALARDGRTVIASIHQPSSEVFELFDQLYLLSSGKTVYFGLASDAYEVIKNLSLCIVYIYLLILYKHDGALTLISCIYYLVFSVL